MKYEKEFASLSRVPMVQGGECIRVEMVISEVKFAALVNALDERKSTQGKELLAMLNNAVDLHPVGGKS